MRICFFGDSIVAGYGDPTCLGWAGRACADARTHGLDVTYYNCGIRRETSPELAARWVEEAVRRLPADTGGRLVFSFGVNDCTGPADSRRVSEEDSLNTARRILQEAEAWLPTLMIGPPPVEEAVVNERIQALSEGYLAICGEFGVPYLDVFDSLREDDVWREEVARLDGNHPQAGGYSHFTKLITEWTSWKAWQEDMPHLPKD